MTILLTRPKEDSSLLANKMRSLNIPVIVEPMFEVELLEGFLVPLNITAGIFTSKHALSSVVNKISKETPICVVGASSAILAKELGFKEVYVAENNVSSLVKLLRSKEDLLGNAVYFSGEIISYNLHEKLEIERIITYRTVPKHSFSPALLSALEKEEIKIAVFYSRNTLSIFMENIKNYDLFIKLSKIKAITISNNIAKCLQEYNWGNILVCELSDSACIENFLKLNYE